jgi:hypothetical protein
LSALGVVEALDESGEYFAVGLVGVAMWLWALVSLAGCAALMRKDRARFIFANRLVGCTALAVISIGGPVAALVVLILFFS